MKAIVCTKYGPPEVLQFKETGGLCEKKTSRPVMFQNERAINSRPTRSGSVDVDPDSGNEIPDTAPDTPQE